MKTAAAPGRTRNWRWFAVLLASVAAVDIWLHYAGSGNRSVGASPQSVPGVEGVSFELRGRESISRAMHAHSPILPGYGKDSYKWTGQITFDGQTGRAELGHVPLAMFKVGDTYYLLANHYFVPERFQWYVFDPAGKQFTVQDNLAAPEALWHVSLPDQDAGRAFRCWCVLVRFQSPPDRERGIALFKEYIASDPRLFAPVYRAGSNDVAARMDSSDFGAVLDAIGESPAAYRGLFETLAMCLQNARKDDPEDIVGSLAWRMLEIDGSRARPLLSEYYAKVLAEANSGDQRLIDLRRFVEAGYIDAPAAAATQAQKPPGVAGGSSTSMAGDSPTRNP